MRQFYELDAVAFQVIDSLDGDSARGDYAGRMTGVVRPLLQWSTQFSPNGHEKDIQHFPVDVTCNLCR